MLQNLLQLRQALCFVSVEVKCERRELTLCYKGILRGQFHCLFLSKQFFKKPWIPFMGNGRDGPTMRTIHSRKLFPIFISNMTPNCI